jgi:hypothetical protein
MAERSERREGAMKKVRSSPQDNVIEKEAAICEITYISLDAKR